MTGGFRSEYEVMILYDGTLLNVVTSKVKTEMDQRDQG